MRLPNFLILPEVRNRSLDDPKAALIHREIIRSKPFLKRLYKDFYHILGQHCPDLNEKICVELGSGGGFIKEIYPTVLTSDLIPLPGIDKNFSVLKMPFKNESVDYFFMLDVFHHVPDSRKFLSEMDRCLKRNGKVIMIEPANTLWGRFIYRNFHHEAFDPAGRWELGETAPLSAANGALPWIVFCRDREIFRRDFPRFKLKEFKAHTPLRYLLSGGVSMRQIMPSFSYPAVKALEGLLSPFHPILGMHYTIVFAKEF